MESRRFVRLSEEHVDACARILSQQWPRQGLSSRRFALRAHLKHAKPEQPLPCHLLMMEGERVLAHCRVQRACENNDGFSAAVVSLVVDGERRGTGCGRQLLQHAEQVAAAAGFGYMYLWTHDAQGFYLKCGYSVCDKVSMHRPALASLGSEAVGKLEALMASRAGSREDPETTARADSTWLRRR